MNQPVILHVILHVIAQILIFYHGFSRNVSTLSSFLSMQGGGSMLVVPPISMGSTTVKDKAWANLMASNGTISKALVILFTRAP